MISDKITSNNPFSGLGLFPFVVVCFVFPFFLNPFLKKKKKEKRIQNLPLPPFISSPVLDSHASPLLYPSPHLQKERRKAPAWLLVLV